MAVQRKGLRAHAFRADPTNSAAKALQADALGQLGYQSEFAVWRNFCLTGAQEPREATRSLTRVSPPRLAETLPLPLLFDYLAMSVNGPAVAGFRFIVDRHLTDTGEARCMTVGNGVPRHALLEPERTTTPDAEVRPSRPTLGRLQSGRDAAAALIKEGCWWLKATPQTSIGYGTYSTGSSGASDRDAITLVTPWCRPIKKLCSLKTSRTEAAWNGQPWNIRRQRRHVEAKTGR